METQTNGFLWTLLTSKKSKKLKNNLIKNKKERANTELTRESDSTKPQSQNKMFSRRKKTILSFTLSLFYLFVAPVMQVLPVYSAEPAAALSVWEFMITELVGANCIITDSAVLSAYGSALSSLPAATATATEINAAIATAAAQCGTDLAPIFANTVSSAANVGITASAASAGENLAATCAAFYNAGSSTSGIVIPALGQAAIDAAGVTGIVAGIAHICKMAYDNWKSIVQFGASIDRCQDLLDHPPIDLGSAGCIGGYVTEWTAANSGVANKYYFNCCLYYPTAGGAKVICLNTGPGSAAYGYRYVGGDWNRISAVGANKYVEVENKGTTWRNRYKGMILSEAPSTYLSKVSSGQLQLPKTQASGLSSVSGPLKWDPTYNNENYPNEEISTPYIPGLNPLPNYNNGYGLEPISLQDYQSIVDAINSYPVPDDLAEQQQQETDIQSLIEPIIQPYFVPIGDPVPDPQPTGSPDPQPTGSPDPQPTGSPNPNPNPKPDTQPFPDPETVPQPTPVVNPTPDSDIVPAPVPYPDPATPSEQEKTDTDTKITPIDLRDKFPFCIPFDMLKIMKLFQGGREAPCFTWEIPFGIAGQGSVTIDLAPWDDVATLMRTLELILFIMLLAVGTRNLLGGSS